MIGQFKLYLAEKDLEINHFKQIKKEIDTSDIVALLINKFFDEDEWKIPDFLEYFWLLATKNLIGTSEIQKGLAILFNQLPNIESDIPRLPVILSHILINICIGDSKLIDFSTIGLHTI